MGMETVGPRIAFAPDGEVHFFDENGKRIDLEPMNREDFIPTVNKNELKAYESISFFSLKDNPSQCKIIIEYDNVIYCFIVDCITGQYLGPCT